MEKHTSLLLITYLVGMALSMIIALSATLPMPTVFIAADCLHASCQLPLEPLKTSGFFLVTGAALGFITILLSRGLYRLFFVNAH